MRGAYLRAREDPDRAILVADWVSQILALNFPFPPMTAKVATTYAEMTSVPCLRHMWTVQWEQKSNRLGHDLMIAAVAITHRMPIITANVEDFLRINEHFDLPGVYHPMKARWFVDPGVEVPLPCFDPSEPDPHEEALPKLPKPPDNCAIR
jgi:hypothetical protein